MSDKKTISVIVRGNVQGIGYRWYVQNLARSRKLAGWVKNLEDGSVEISAQGSKEALEEFIASLRKHTYARVTSIETQWLDGVGQEFVDFSIRF